MNFKNKIVYEIYIKSFKDSNSSGEGDIKGLIKKMDYIKSLGITTIWITPFYESPMIDEGYDISDYYKVNKNMGIMKNVNKLIKKCNELNIEIMLDFVLNHTSSNHTWFKKALKGSKKYQDYYFFSEKPKTEWIGRFGGKVWEYVPIINKYYLHLYDKTQPDLNWDNPNVREEMYKVVEFWLKKKIIAYKFDVLYLISKPTKDWKPSGKIPSAIACRDGENVHKYIRELMAKIKNKFPETYSVGEMSFSSDESCAEYSNPKNKEIQILMSGKITNALPNNASDNLLREELPQNSIYIQNIKKLQLLIQKSDGWLCNFSSNHDSPRTINKFGSMEYRDLSAKSHILNISFLRGTPFFHQGQEIAMINPNYESINDYKDIKSINAINSNHNLNKKELLKLIDRNSRDSGRNPMIWNNTKNGGWSESNSPWRKTNPKHLEKYNVEEQEKDNDSVLNFFKEVINIRKKNDILNYGTIKFIECDENVIAYERVYNDKKIVIFVNMSSKVIQVNKKYTLPKILISNYKNFSFNSEIKLRPWEAFAIKIN